MGNSTVAGNVALFELNGGKFLRPIEEAIRAAKRKASAGAAVRIIEHSSGAVVATVWPGGKVDATFHGSQFVTTWETTK